MSELSDVVEQVRRKVARYGKTGVNEQNTKATLIQPLLRALGWDVEDLDNVHLEYRQKGKDKPVDYALLLLRSPCLFLEAKSLGEPLDDRKWANQVMGYASVAGVQWVVLTDGDEYRIYNSHATVPVEEKLFRKVRLSDESTPPEKTLWLLSKEQIQERQINRLWDAHFVDRQVKAASRRMAKWSCIWSSATRIENCVADITPQQSSSDGTGNPPDSARQIARSRSLHASANCRPDQNE